MMRAFVQDPLVALVLRAALALLFASAARHKLGDLPRFRATVRSYRLLPAALVDVAAPLLVAVELAVAAALVVPGARWPGALGAIALLGLYAGAIAVNLRRGRRTIDCGCGGPGARQPISEWLVIRNLLLIGVTIGTLVPVAPRPLLWIDWFGLVAALAMLSCLWIAAHGLAAASARVPALQEAAP